MNDYRKFQKLMEVFKYLTSVKSFYVRWIIWIRKIFEFEWNGIGYLILKKCID